MKLQSEDNRASTQSDADNPTPNAAKLAPALNQSQVTDIVDEAVGAMAPLWPLESFVAVNPFLGISNLPYAEADIVVDRVWGARLVMPRSFYADALRAHRIRKHHVDQALEQLSDSMSQNDSADSVMLLAASEEPVFRPVSTIASLLAEATNRDWPRLVIDSISSWSANYYDEGQAIWRSPWRDEDPYTAWRGSASIDRTPELMGVARFRHHIAGLPKEPDELLLHVATRLRLNRVTFDLYIRRLLATIAGWAGHARYRGWQEELAGGSGAGVRQLLAVRAAWEMALLEAFDDTHPSLAQELREQLALPPHPEVMESHRANLVLHTAYEIASREWLFESLASNVDTEATDTSKADAPQPEAQVVFCIDVRSEPYRRALEKSSSGIETLGFAGFFGFALEVAPIDRATGNAQCPVLLTPQFLVRETIADASETNVEQAKRKTWFGRRIAAAKKQFSAAAISSFAFVESMGLAFAWKLVADTLHLRTPAKRAAFVPTVESSSVDGRIAGIPFDERVQLAKGALQGMSLTQGLAPLVALVGHGATTTNNPYASRFNCGACGGHTGEANAIVAAQVLNDPQIRSALAEHGIDIPAETLFVAGLHDTTTDDVSLIASDSVTGDARERLDRLETAFEKAGEVARRERLGSFKMLALDNENANANRKLRKRSRDWSEIRPEWGLAGCMAFIAAPRRRTVDINLRGRSFLHSYEFHRDQEHAVLELIMTAPLVVATWISLQYYASTIDNTVFGSGDKTLHNVVGGFGVLEGNSGDLRVGLPQQSLHDGSSSVHEPVRLNAIIEAPVEAISGILEKHDGVRTLVDNGWIHLFALLDEGATIKRYQPGGQWVDATHKGDKSLHAQDDLWMSQSA